MKKLDYGPYFHYALIGLSDEKSLIQAVIMEFLYNNINIYFSLNEIFTLLKNNKIKISKRTGQRYMEELYLIFDDLKLATFGKTGYWRCEKLPTELH